MIRLNRKITGPSQIFLAVILSLIAFGCATQNPEAPAENQTHPPLYILDHAAEAQADLTSCQTCHGIDFQGTGNPVPGCFTCHASGPPFSVHPLPYNDPADHGPAARADQLGCRGCHGDPPNNFDGGIVADPDLFNTPAGTCSTQECHPAAKAHPTNWQGTNEDNDPSYDSTHRVVGESTVNSNCALCHRTAGPGNGAMPGAPSCFSPSFTNSGGVASGCHADGFDQAPHVLPFTDTALHGPEAKNDLTYCQQCHAVPFSGGPGSNPRFNVPIGRLVNGCEDCHAVETAHPVPLWTGPAAESHKTADNLDTACALCHGVTLSGGAGPACNQCHTAGNPLVDANCTSCHTSPPDGGSRPNREASHAVHDALAGVTDRCQVCHEGYGSDTANHFDDSDPADVKLSNTYKAQTGTLSYNATGRSCSGVSCHGGQTTPNWETGSITVNTDCTDCHAVNANQYNSPSSGDHRRHVIEEGFDCTDCHNADDPVNDPVDGSIELLSANHFVGLDTSTLEGDPARTIRYFMNYNTGGESPTCTFGALSRCHNTTEHDESKKWD